MRRLLLSDGESKVVREILGWLNGLEGARARKVHPSRYAGAGEPDVDAVVRGRAVKLEVKAPGASRGATALQLKRLREWASAGAVTGVVRSVGDVRELLAREGLVEPDV